MTRIKICSRCGHTFDIRNYLKKNITTKIVCDNDQCTYEKIYCPYYQHSEICRDAYYYSYNIEECFKDAYSCCYCAHRIGDDDNNFFCDYDSYDKEVKNMYYLQPLITSEITEFKKFKVVTTYWECPICKSLYEVSRKEKEIL